MWLIPSLMDLEGGVEEMRIRDKQALLSIRIEKDRFAVSSCGTKKTRCAGDSCGGEN